MRAALWPDGEADHPYDVARYFQGLLREPLEVLLAFDDGDQPVGFAELSIRPYAEGGETGRVAYLEGWYVDAHARRRGVGRALVTAAEEWARFRGCTEFGSDALIDNDISAAAHAALGFAHVESIRCFIKNVGGAEAFHLREATLAEAAAIADAHIDSIRTIGPRFYAPDVVAAWAAAVTPAMYVAAMAAGEVFFVAGATAGRVAGFSSHVPREGSHGLSVYVRGEAAGRGLGSRLLQLAEERAVAHGAGSIEIEASLPGLAFYDRHGFTAVGPADVRFGAVAIPCVMMRKLFAQAGGTRSATGIVQPGTAGSASATS